MKTIELSNGHDAMLIEQGSRVIVCCYEQSVRYTKSDLLAMLALFEHDPTQEKPISNFNCNYICTKCGGRYNVAYHPAGCTFCGGRRAHLEPDPVKVEKCGHGCPNYSGRQYQLGLGNPTPNICKKCYLKREPDPAVVKSCGNCMFISYRGMLGHCTMVETNRIQYGQCSGQGFAFWKSDGSGRRQNEI